MTEVTYHGHSIVQFEHEGTKGIFDPFITGNELTDLKVDDVEVDYILLTHGHNDHVGDTMQIAKNNDATVIAPVELAEYLGNQGLNTIGMNIGGETQYDNIKVKYVQAFHSSSYTDDEGQVFYTGMPTGIILTLGDKKIYHVGDTALFSDLNLISEINGKFDVAFVPIGDHFTMGISDAIHATDHLIKPEIVVPIHYNTFPPIKQNPQNFKQALQTECQILNAGEAVKFK